MNLTELGELDPVRKDPKSNSGDCCALYRTKDGGHVIVGLELEDVDPAELAFGLNVGKGERPVYVPPGVLAE